MFYLTPVVSKRTPPWTEPMCSYHTSPPKESASGHPPCGLELLCGTIFYPALGLTTTSQPVDTRAKVLGSPACYHLVFECLGPYSLRFETKPLELEPGATRI